MVAQPAGFLFHIAASLRNHRARIEVRLIDEDRPRRHSDRDQERGSQAGPEDAAQ